MRKSQLYLNCSNSKQPHNSFDFKDFKSSGWGSTIFKETVTENCSKHFFNNDEINKKYFYQYISTHEVNENCLNKYIDAQEINEKYFYQYINTHEIIA